MQSLSNKQTLIVSGGDVNIGPIVTDIDITPWIGAFRIFDGFLTDICGAPKDLEGVSISLHMEQPPRSPYLSSDDDVDTIIYM